MIGTLNTGYYLDRKKQTQIRIWGSQGWLHLDLISGKPIEWYSTHPDAPRGVQQYRYTDAHGLYYLFFEDAISAALGRAKWPITSQESLRVLKIIFGAYEAAETGMTQTVG